MDSIDRASEAAASHQSLSRRGFLRLSAGIGAAAGVSALLAACGAAATSPSAAGTSPKPSVAASAAGSAPASAAGKPAGGGPVKLPIFQPPADAPKPDFPGSPDGIVAPGYINWPKQPFQSVKKTVGDGSDVTIFTNVQNQPPVAVDQNPAWQAWNKSMNVNLKFSITSFADLAPKFATTIAGNDLPDIVTTLQRQDIPLVPELFESKAADLTPYLSGENIKEFPNLAALPTRSWKSMIYNNKIFGVPIPTPYGQFFWWPFIHQELLDQLGTPGSQPKTTDDYKKMMVALTKPQQNQYGVVSQGGYQYSFDMNTGNGWYPAMFGAPNLWAVDSSGKFTHTFETDQYKQALAYTTDLYKAGIFHPDTPTLNVVTAAQAFIARKGCFVDTGLNQQFWIPQGTAAASLSPAPNVNLLTPPAAPGMKPQYYNGRPAFGIAFLKKAPEARVKMMLRVLDFIAAPFGSQEYELIHFGVKGTDYQPDANGNPILTQKGQADLAGAGTFLVNVVTGWQVLYSAADPKFPERLQGYEKILAPISVEDGSIGLFSQTQASKGVPVIQKFGDGITDIVAGRRPLSDLDSLIKDWKSSGGETIRAEYEKAYAASK